MEDKYRHPVEPVWSVSAMCQTDGQAIGSAMAPVFSEGDNISHNIPSSLSTYYYENRSALKSVRSSRGSMEFTGAPCSGIVIRGHDDTTVRKVDFSYITVICRDVQKRLLTGYTVTSGTRTVDAAAFTYHGELSGPVRSTDLFGYCNDSQPGNRNSRYRGILEFMPPEYVGMRGDTIIQLPNPNDPPDYDRPGSGSTVSRTRYLALSNSRKPHAQSAMRYALKSVETLSGAVTELEYEPNIIRDAWRGLANATDLIIGLRLRRETVTDRVTGTTRTRTFEYHDPVPSVDFAGDFGRTLASFTSEGGVMKTINPYGMVYLETVSTGVTMLAGSRCPGASPESCMIYYGKVVEKTGGTGLADSIVTAYRYNLDGATNPLFTSAAPIYIQPRDRRYCGTYTSDLYPVFSYMTLAFNIFSPMPLNGYYRERLGDRSRLVSRTEYRTAENGDTVPLRLTTYSYSSDDDRRQTTGYFCEPLVRFQSIYDIETDKFKTPADFEHFPIETVWRVDRLASETVTEYAEDGTSRTVVRSFSYVPAAGYTTPTSRKTMNHIPGLIRSETVSCAGQSLTTTRRYAYDAAAGPLKTACDRGWIALEGSRTVTLYTGASLTRRNTYGDDLWPRSEVTVTADGNVIDSIAITCDSKGNPLSVARNGSIPVTYTWSPQGYPLSKTTGGTLKTLYAWKPLVGVSSVTSPSGMSSTYVYDGELLVSAAVNGVPAVRYAYSWPGEADAVYNGNSVAVIPVDADGNYWAASVKVTGASGVTVAEATGVPGGNFITTLTISDALGRPTRTYAPVTTDASPDLDGKSVENMARQQYAYDTAPFSAITYTAGADMRPRTLTITGGMFAGHPARRAYSFNRYQYTAGSPAASWQICRRYSVTADGSLKNDGQWPDGSLEIVKSTDGDGRVSYTYTDFLGRTVLIRTDLSSGPGNSSPSGQYLDTYYVYDDSGRLAYVLPPMASSQLTTAGKSWSLTNSNSLGLYAFRYTYDGRWRMASKKAPACDQVTFVTDLTGAVTLVQDGVQRSRGICSFTLNDPQGRPAISGQCKMTDALVSAVSASAVHAVRDASAQLGYRPGLTMTDVIIDRAWYYDDYTFLQLRAFSGVSGNYGASVPRKGLCLGSLSRVLDSRDSGTRYIASVSFKDARERPVKTVTSTLSGLRVTEQYTYDNADRVTGRTSTLHDNAGVTRNSLSTLSSYDPHGRPVSVSSCLDSRITSVTANTYDALGRLSGSRTGSFSTAYTYTTGGAPASISTGGRSWLTLGYGNSFTGMLTSQTWSGADKVTRGYAYRYDGAGRLAAANYTESGRGTPGQYSTAYSYDSNSNLTSVIRHGLSGVATASGSTTLTYGVVDDLDLSYEGNRLIKADDSADAPVYTGAPDFSDGADRPVELTYDGCGRLLSDSNRGIDSVAYNTLGLPETIRFNHGAYIRQIYLADGQLLRRVTADTQLAGGTIVSPGLPTLPGVTLPGITLPGGGHEAQIKLRYDSTDYVGPMVFNNDRLSRVEIPGGFIAGDSVHAYLHDHQGNVRRVVNTHTGVVEQETHYYPFGMPFGESTATALRTVNGSALQPRRYGGKESVSLGAFTFLDFPARPYDAATARFLTPDPMQEDYTPFSPYLYCMGNPMNFTDPTGMFVVYEGSEEEREQLKGIIAGERQDKLFDRIFQALDDSNVKFTLKFGEIKRKDSKGFNMGVFNKKNKTITLSPLLNERKGGQLHSTVAEESYHAYQSITPEINNVNIEYEAQTFAYIHTINLNCEYLTHHLVELNANIENFITSTPTNINGNLVDKTCFIYRPNFPTCYKAGFNYFLDSVKNINSSHYTNPSDAIPYRLLNILMTVTWLP